MCRLVETEGLGSYCVKPCAVSLRSWFNLPEHGFLHGKGSGHLTLLKDAIKAAKKGESEAVIDALLDAFNEYKQSKPDGSYSAPTQLFARSFLERIWHMTGKALKADDAPDEE